MRALLGLLLLTLNAAVLALARAVARCRGSGVLAAIKTSAGRHRPIAAWTPLPQHLHDT